MYPRTGAWTMAQSIAKLEADVTQLKLALRTKVVYLSYTPDNNNRFAITFTIPADIKTDTVQDIYDLFVTKNSYYLQLPCTGELKVNGVSATNIRISSDMNYPGGSISGFRVTGLGVSDSNLKDITIYPNMFQNIDMRITII